MPLTLTTEQILALAPDSASAKAGQGLAGPRKWVTLGSNERAVWGECQGSGKDPYQVQADLGDELAYKCSCPSRKLPCKHTLGLLLMLANQRAAFTQNTTPAWVEEWLAKRTQTAQKRVEKQERAAQAPDPATEAKRAASQARSAAARENRIAAGLLDLERWMSDLIRQGLADAQGKHSSFWDGMAARMVDSQAPGVARMLRAIGDLSTTSPRWQDQALERLSRLHLLIEGFKQLGDLPSETQADIRTALGLATREEELVQQAGVRDQWLVLGQRVEEEDTLLVQRTWLWGTTGQQPALLLSFSAAGQPLDRSLIIGTSIDAELSFYPGAFPLRAIIKTRHAPPDPFDLQSGHRSISEAVGTYAAALAANPWLAQFPLRLQEVLLIPHEQGWHIRDSSGYMLPLAPAFLKSWHLMALSGGRPLTLFGEWDGDYFMPLGTQTSRYTSL